jgi:hypothetical protein
MKEYLESGSQTREKELEIAKVLEESNESIDDKD